jgi:hypothetical protein
MRRPRRASNIDARISHLVTGSIDQLVAAITEEIRRNVATEIQTYLTNAGSGARAGRIAARRLTAPRKKRIRPCIAPGCTNPSKGPRFHYLCAKHMDAPRKDYEAWRARKMDAAA